MEAGYGVVYVRVDRWQYCVFVLGVVVVVGMREENTFIAMDNILALISDLWIKAIACTIIDADPALRESVGLRGSTDLIVRLILEIVEIRKLCDFATVLCFRYQ